MCLVTSVYDNACAVNWEGGNIGGGGGGGGEGLDWFAKGNMNLIKKCRFSK